MERNFGYLEITSVTQLFSYVLKVFAELLERSRSNLYIYILINKFTRSKDSRFNVEIDILWNENDMHILLG